MHTRRAKQYILPVLKSHPRLKMFVLDYALPEDVEAIQAAADRAATFGFLFAVGPICLDQVYRSAVVGRPDGKWLEKQATPERLSYTLANGQNGWPAKTMILPSGCFGGYSVMPVVDGIADRSGLHWSKAAWASAEDGEPAWLEIRLPAPLAGGAIRVEWMSGQISQACVVQVRRGGTWHDVSTLGDGQTQRVEVRLPSEPFEAIRLWQSETGGSVSRPNLMWVQQIAYIAADGGL